MHDSHIERAGPIIVKLERLSHIGIMVVETKPHVHVQTPNDARLPGGCLLDVRA